VSGGGEEGAAARFVDGARRAARRPKVVLALLGLELCAIHVALLPLSVLLEPLLDPRPGAWAIATGADDALLAELVVSHPELAPVAAGALCAALVTYVALAFVGAGALTATLVPDELEAPRGAGAVLGATGRLAPCMLALGALSLLLRCVAAAAWIAGVGLARPDRAASTAGLMLRHAAPALVGGVAFALGTVALDAARGARTVDGGAGAGQLLRDGLLLLWRCGAARRLALLSLCTTTLLGALQLIALRLPPAGWAIALGYLVAAVRAFAGAATLAASGRLGAAAARSAEAWSEVRA
jgi:hypothetical protein